MNAQPDLGVYLQPDPKHRSSARAFSGPQAYAYASGRPLVLTDPLGLRPGDPYNSPEAAARAALEESMPISRSQGREYSGLIYKWPGSSSCTYTLPLKGIAANADGPEALKHRHRDLLSRSTGSLCADNERAIVMAWYHTHGDFSGEWYKFSADDIDISNDSVLDAYLGTPSGSFLYYNVANPGAPSRIRPDIAGGMAPPAAPPGPGYWQ